MEGKKHGILTQTGLHAHTHVQVEEVLLLWDRIIGLDSLLPVALLAVAVMCFRRVCRQRDVHIHSYTAQAASKRGGQRHQRF